MLTHTIQLHRVLRATPEKVYRAFLDADAMVKWLPPNGYTGKVHHLEAKVGETYKMLFTNFATGKSHSLHELKSYTDYVSGESLAFWRSKSGFEVDFILGDHTAIELKASENVAPNDLKSLKALAEERKLKRYLCVSLEARHAMQPQTL